MPEVSAEARPLPVGSVGDISSGRLGMACVIATEAALFGYLLFAQFYYAVLLGPNWLPQHSPGWRLPLVAVLLLVGSSVAVWWGQQSLKQGRASRLALGVAIAFVLGLAFCGLQLADWRDESLTLRSSEFTGVFFTLTGLHLAHAVAGLLGLLLLLAWSLLGYIDAIRSAPVLIVGAYWHFVVAVGVVVFLALYVTPQLW